MPGTTALILLLLVPAPVSPRVAVIAVDDAAGLPSSDVEALTDRARTELEMAGLDIVPRDDVRGWSCRDQACRRRVLAPQGIRYWVTTGITGSERVYELHMRVWSAEHDTALAESTQRCVVCGQAELADGVAAQASALVGSIVTDASESVLAASNPRAGSTAAAGITTAAEPVKHGAGSAEGRRGGHDSQIDTAAAWRRPVGIGMAAAGVATIALGSGLLAIDGEALPRRCGRDHADNLDAEGDCRYVHNTQGGGITSIVAGALFSTVGVALLIVDARSAAQERRERAQVSLDIGLRRLGVRGRF